MLSHPLWAAVWTEHGSFSAFLKRIVQEGFLSWIKGSPLRNTVYVLHSFMQLLLENEPNSSSEESDHNSRTKWKWPKKKNINGAILNPCHWPLEEDRKQSRKHWHAELPQPQRAASGHTFLVRRWGTPPRLQGGNLQNISSKSSGRASFSFHSAAISQASPLSDSLSGYQPRSLTLEVADKRFHMKTARQNWQESTAIAAWLQVLVGTEPETKLPHSGWYRPSCPLWVSFDTQGA